MSLSSRDSYHSLGRRRSRYRRDRRRLGSSLETSLLAAFGHGIIGTDAEDRISYWNPFVEKLYGWSAAETIGRSTRELLSTRPSPGPAARLLQRLHRREYGSDEYLIERPDGTRYPVLAIIWPVPDQAGRPGGTVAYCIDLTEHHQETAQRYQAERAAGRLEPVMN